MLYVTNFYYCVIQINKSMDDATFVAYCCGISTFSLLLQ